MSEDIVERIRALRYVHVPVASQVFEEAAAEIERLRLTDLEREAIEYAAVAISGPDKPRGWPLPQDKLERIHVLRSLLKRLSVPAK